MRACANSCTTLAFQMRKSSNRRQALSHRGPRLFHRHIDNPRFGGFGRRKDSQKNQLSGEWVVRSVDFTHWDEGHFAGLENATLPTDPLFGLASHDVNQFL